MKKTLLLLTIAAAAYSANAQNLIHENGPIITDPGLGAGGNDVSAIQPGLSNFGFNHNRAGGFRVAEDITIGTGDQWTIDSLVFFGYQTGSSVASTFSNLNFVIWDKAPDDPTAQVVYGDTATNALANSYFSGIYRTNGTDFSNTQRPVMRLVANTPNLVLSPGTYWIDWQAGGTLTSGPWVPPVAIVGQPTMGNAMQLGSSGSWQAVNDIPTGGTGNNPVTLPFEVYGQTLLVNSAAANVNLAHLSLYPNPATSTATVSFDAEVLKANGSVNLAVVDALGRTVQLHRNLTTNQHQLQRQNLPAGMYVVELSNANGLLGRTRLVLN